MGLLIDTDVWVLAEKSGAQLNLARWERHGSAYMSAYSGLKAFGLNFAEGLWAELSPHGVDVLYLALSTTDTPALRRLLSAKGLLMVAGLADPAEVAAHALDRLPHGPIANWWQADDQPGMSPVSAAARRQRVLAIG